MKLVKITVYVLLLLGGIGATIVTHLSGHIWLSRSLSGPLAPLDSSTRWAKTVRFSAWVGTGNSLRP